MKVVVRIAAKDLDKGWDLLIRHSPGTALPDRTFIISEDAVRALRKAGIKFKELSREEGEPSQEGTVIGERI